MTRRRYVIGVSVTAAALVMSGISPVSASTESEADLVAGVVEQAAPVELSASVPTTRGSGLSVTFDEGGDVSLPQAATEAMRFTTNDGTVGASVGLPGASGLSVAEVASDGSVAYLGNEATPSVHITASSESVRISSVIANAEQTQDFTYNFGEGVSVEVQEDGSAIALMEDIDASNDGAHVETVVATIAAPWAVDAAGDDVATEYVAEGATLTQVVHHQDENVEYPVVADPTFDQPNILQQRVRFDRAETATIAQNGLMSLGGAVCGPVMAVVCIGAAGVLAYNAGVAENSHPKRCVQITATNTFTPANIVWWVDTYLEGPCR